MENGIGDCDRHADATMCGKVRTVRTHPATSVPPTRLPSQRVCGVICNALEQSESWNLATSVLHEDISVLDSWEWPRLPMLGITWRRGADYPSALRLYQHDIHWHTRV